MHLPNHPFKGECEARFPSLYSVLSFYARKPKEEENE